MTVKQILVRKADGQNEPFDIQKLEHSLEHAQASKEAIQHVTQHIIQELEDGMTTHEIYKHAFDLLRKFDHRTALQYSLRRAVLDLGPSGFPFEKLVAELFKKKGYSTLTDQVVKGYCAEHEVDVVAWKKESLIMSEVKFHGQLGLKSDLKVVLYVKARFEDLAKATFDYDKEAGPMPLSEGWLVTNTKFTVSAIKYAECQGMKVIGWNYPLDNNLHDLIDEMKLYPLTLLHSLSEHDKKTLLDQGYIVCSTLADTPSLLEDIGLSEANREAVLDEIKVISEPQALKGKYVEPED